MGLPGIFAASLPLHLPTAGTARIPTIPGLLALKLAAWLDRSPRGELKDATEIALTLFWHATAQKTVDLLYETQRGNDLLVDYETDPELAAAYLLGEDTAVLLGEQRLPELQGRWSDVQPELLARAMNLDHISGWTRSVERRVAFINALARGLFTGSKPDNQAELATGGINPQ